MVKFIVVTIKKKFGTQIVNGQLNEPAEVLHWEHQESKINDYLMKGFEIVHTMDLEDTKGVYILFILKKKPSIS